MNDSQDLPRYRIENEQNVTLNNRKCILFDAYEYNPENKGYVFMGRFTAPKHTKSEDLVGVMLKKIDEMRRADLYEERP